MRARWHHRIGTGHLLAAVAAAVPMLAIAIGGRTPVDLTPEAHFWPVLLAAGTAAVVAAGLTLAGVRARDGRAILLGTAFSTTTALLAVHGFATPGVVVGMNGVIALAGGISLPVGAGLLALTALPGLRHPRRIAPLLVLQAVLAIGVLTLGALALAMPTLVPMRAEGREPAGDRAARLRARSASPCSCTGLCARTRSPAVPPTCWWSPAARGSACRCTPSSRSGRAPPPSTAATPWSSAGSR